MKKSLALLGMGEGNGMAIARRFAQAGYAIAMMARNENKLQGFQQTLQSEGYEAHYFITDAGNAESLKAAFTSIQTTLGNPEILIYNAAVLKMKNILDETLESLTQDFQVNVAGALTATQEVLPGMRQQGKGSIIFTGGGFSMYPSADFASLSIGKAGIRSLAKILNDRLSKEGIRVGLITICGMISPTDPKYNPASIAENYWNFHNNNNSETEIIY